MSKRYRFSNGQTFLAHLNSQHQVLVQEDGKDKKRVLEVSCSLDPRISFIKNRRILSWFGGFLEVEVEEPGALSDCATRGLPPAKISMPGKVVVTQVKEGDVVEKGQCLLVIEAMKMENNILAAKRAKVAKLHVRQGQLLEAGATLITFQEA